LKVCITDFHSTASRRNQRQREATDGTQRGRAATKGENHAIHGETEPQQARELWPRMNADDTDFFEQKEAKEAKRMALRWPFAFFADFYFFPLLLKFAQATKK
jgi:hypothetical protein